MTISLMHYWTDWHSILAPWSRTLIFSCSLVCTCYKSISFNGFGRIERPGSMDSLIAQTWFFSQRKLNHREIPTLSFIQTVKSWKTGFEVLIAFAIDLPKGHSNAAYNWIKPFKYTEYHKAIQMLNPWHKAIQML